MPPDYLYKYRAMTTFTDLDRLVDAVTTGTFWAAAASTFNDPFDCSPRLTVAGTEEELIRWAFIGQEDDPGSNEDKLARAVVYAQRTLQRDETQLELNHRRIEDFARENMTKHGIFCAAERFDCPLMWGHYAAQHEGVCMELSTAAMLLGHQFRQVRYVNERPEVSVAHDGSHAAVAELEMRVLGTKSAMWSYEREWRLIRRDQVGRLVLGPNAVSALILGERINRSKRSAVIKAVQDERPGLPVYLSHQDDTTFAMVRDRLI